VSTATAPTTEGAIGQDENVQPQSGIFAQGTVEHSYLELDLLPDVPASVLLRAMAALSGPESTVGGVSIVLALRPELWAQVSGTAVTARSFTSVDGEDFQMPATQHDAWLWIAGGARDAVFDSTLTIVRALASLARVGSGINGWVYQHDRDLTGFEDGTENPSALEAPGVAVAPDGTSVVLVQQWRHFASWETLPVAEQERVIGRTKDDSTELAEDIMPADSHVSRTVVEQDGEELEIFRRNTAYGDALDHGTVFVAFCATQGPLALMLARMAGHGDGIRDALTRYTQAVTGAYYVAPSATALLRLLET
jgi:putative iron-dependent peroxidase